MDGRDEKGVYSKLFFFQNTDCPWAFAWWFEGEKAGWVVSSGSFSSKSRNGEGEKRFFFFFVF